MFERFFGIRKRLDAVENKMRETTKRLEEQAEQERLREGKSPREKPKSVVHVGKEYHRRPDGTYQDDDGSILPEALLAVALLSSSAESDSGKADTAASFEPGGGAFGGGGASGGFEVVESSDTASDTTADSGSSSE